MLSRCSTAAVARLLAIAAVAATAAAAAAGACHRLLAASSKPCYLLIISPLSHPAANGSDNDDIMGG